MVSATLLAACQNFINMPLTYAQLNQGFVNGSTHDLGHVFVWDTKTNNLAQIYKIEDGDVATARIVRGRIFDKQKAFISNETKVVVSGRAQAVAAFNADVKANVETAVSNTTDVEFAKFQRREYQSPTSALNSRELREWREDLANTYADPKYRFIFISSVIDADSLAIAKKKTINTDTEANVATVGEFKFKVLYNNSAGITTQGSNVPMVIKPTVYRFKIDQNKSPAGYRFIQDIDLKFSFQSVTGV